MKKIRVIIVDDEQHAQMLIEKYLKCFDDVEVIEKYSNGFDAVMGIQNHKPDIVFLDVQMPKLNGFEVLELLDDYPVIVFSTAYDEFAIKAFEVGAADYLLKPYSKDRFEKALLKAKEKLNIVDKTPKLIQNYVHENNDEIINRIAVKYKSKIEIVSTTDIHYIEAQDDYVMIYTKDSSYLKESTMKYYEHNLNKEEFVRVHRSYIVRINQISRVENYEKNSHIIILKSGTRIKVSRSGYEKLKSALNI